MSTRIPGGGISGRNPFGPVWTGGKEPVRTVGEQVQDTLFGKPKPRVLDQDDADTAAQMARLNVYKGRLARLAGDAEDDYRLLLADGTIAMIDESGTIYVGKRFLLDHADHVDVQVGVLAHEIGHRPRRWSEYRQQQKLSREESDKLCRTEETRADYFCGRALAELGMGCGGIIAFLEKVQVHPHPEYFSAKLRAEVIREGHDDGTRRAADVKKFFPELARHRGPRGDLGEG